MPNSHFVDGCHLLRRDELMSSQKHASNINFKRHQQLQPQGWTLALTRSPRRV